MIIINLGSYEAECDDMPGIDARYVEALNDKLPEKFPGMKYKLTLQSGTLSGVESDGTDDPATPDPDPDDVYRFVMDTWVDLVLGPPTESDEEP